MSKIPDIENILEKGGEIADNLTTTAEEERELLQSAHEVDMKSDSWLSKNIRPLFLVFTCGGWLIAVVLGSFEQFTLPSEAMDVLKVWGEFAIAFYFGARGWEKVERTRMKRDVVNARIERKANRRGLFKKKNNG